MNHKQVFYKFIILLFFCLSISSFVSAMTFIPRVVNYSVSDYKAGNQNWAVSQDQNGIMYFGNNRGLLQYDGNRWTLYKLPNNRAVRSVYVDKYNHIYVGSFEEFGFFKADETGTLVYHSLKPLVKNFEFLNDEIWNIVSYKDQIYFQSFGSYFKYDGKFVTPSRKHDLLPLYFHKVRDEVYVQMIKGDIYNFDGTDYIPLLSKEKFNNDEVVAILPFQKNKSLFFSGTNGIFLYDGTTVSTWDTSINEELKNNSINRAVLTKDSTIVIGTISNGIYAINQQGKLIWHLNKDSKLINNTILRLYNDLNNNIWGATDNGISLIQNNSPIYFYEPQDIQIGMIYDMQIKGDNIYLASNQGLYHCTKTNGKLELINGTKGQTWHISNIDGQLICGNNKGTFLIEDHQAKSLQDITGATSIRKCVIQGQEILLQASYSTLNIFNKDESGKWKFSHVIEGFSNPIKQLEVDYTGNIWASHMYKGFYKINLDETLTKIKDIEYISQLDSTKKESTINIMKLRGRIVFSDENNFYTYEDLNSSIELYEKLNSDLPDIADTYQIKSINNDLFWFIRNTEYLLVNHVNGSFNIQERIPFSQFENPSIEDEGNIYISNDGTSYFCLNGELGKYENKNTYKTKIPFHIGSVEINLKNSKETERLPLLSQNQNVHYNKNNISFVLNYPEYNGHAYKIRYDLQKGDDILTFESTELKHEYSNLSAGNYLFTATIIDNAGNEIANTGYHFSVERAPYLSAYAIIGYLLVFMGLLYVLIKLNTSRAMKQKNRLYEKKQAEQRVKMENQEKLIAELQKKRLEAELSYKSKELAGITMSSIAKNEFLEELKRNIQQQIISGQLSKRFLEKLIQDIDDNTSEEKEWVLFQKNFDMIHQNFFRNLRNGYPSLTPNDLKLCALLRLNMSTKDMAKSSNLTIRGIEAARYRLRKKLDIPDGKSLVDFMIEFK